MKKGIYIVLILLVIGFVILSFYTTFAFDEEVSKLEDSTANYNLVYSLKEKDVKKVMVARNNELYVDVMLTNTYKETVNYGMYYYLNDPNKMPQGVEISLANSSPSPLQGLIKGNETKVVSLKISNNSNYNVDLSLGALVGFENGNIEELQTEGFVLIK